MAEGPDCGRGLSLPAVDTTLGRLGSRASRGQTVLCSHHGCYPRPLSLSWGPQLLLTSCPGPAMCLRPHTPHFVLSTPQTGPSGCEHPPPRGLPFTQHPFTSPSPSLLPSHQALWIQPPFPLPFSIPTYRAQGPPPPTGLTCGERLGQKEKGPPPRPWG